MKTTFVVLVLGLTTVQAADENQEVSNDIKAAANSEEKPKAPEPCWNNNKCCAMWAGTGECLKNPTYMLKHCMASCGHCTPQYQLADVCDDRHPRCAEWAYKGECTKNPKWMHENCRSTCDQCKHTRKHECNIGKRQRSPSVLEHLLGH